MAATPPRVTYRVPLRKKGILTVPQEIRSALGDEDDVIFEWEPMPDGSYRVTPLGTHKLDVAWFYKEQWIEKERDASAQASRGEGVELPTAEDAVEFLTKRLGEQK